MTEKTVANSSTPDLMDTGNGEGAQADDLDSILASLGEEFDSDTKTATTQAKPDEDTLAQFKQFMESQQTKETLTDIESAADKVIGYLDEDVKASKKVVRGLLKELALENPNFDKAFENRYTNSSAWDKVLKGAAVSVAKELSGGKVDDQVTADRAQMAATVAGSSTIANDDKAPDFNNMSDAEFNKFKQGIRD